MRKSREGCASDTLTGLSLHCTGGFASTPSPQCWQAYARIASKPGNTFNSPQWGHLEEVMGRAGFSSSLCVPSRWNVIKIEWHVLQTNSKYSLSSDASRAW